MSSETKGRPGHGQDEDGSSRIKVTDRRHFTTEGERRADETPASAEPATRTGADRTMDAEAASPPRTAAASDPPRSIDFIAFVHSLSVGALMALGEVENPVSHAFETNLDLARQNIDILAMLRDKTAGNLSPEEESFLTEVVPQVQLLYVRKARG